MPLQFLQNSKGFILKAAFVALFSLKATSGLAGMIHVPAGQPTIQQAINAAVAGDVILVAPGTYFERVNFNGKAISLRSTAGPELTVLDGSNAGTVVTFSNGEGGQSVLEGFTIQHGKGSPGGGVSCGFGSSPSIRRNIFRNNAQGDGSGGSGAAIEGFSASPTIEGNMFFANSCDTQYFSAVVSFANSSSPRIFNNIFAQNPCLAINLVLPEGNYPVVANNTFVQNRAAVVAEDYRSSTHLYANNILVGNLIGYYVESGGGGKPPKWINNLVFGNQYDYTGVPNQTGSNGNIASDPAFFPGTNNFRLQASSPAIDAGTPTVAGLPSTDVAGNPRVIDGNGDGSAVPDIGAFEFPTSGLVGNVSTRLVVGANDDVLIEGFTVEGPPGSLKKIMVRALGPSLDSFGVTDALGDPTLEIRDADNAAMAANNDWTVTQRGGLITNDQFAEIRASGLAPDNPLESVIIAALAPGRYTAVVRGVENTVGTGLVDAYDMIPGSAARLVNFATRGLVQPGDKLMIAGFIVQYASMKTVVRGIGPSLAQFGIGNALPDTTLELRDKDGAIVIANDNWQTDPAQKAELESYKLEPSHELEAALITTMPPGQYTAQLRGKDNTSGIGVVEVYFVQ